MEKNLPRNYSNLFVSSSYKDPTFDLIYTVLAELQRHQPNELMYSCLTRIKVKLWLSQASTPVLSAELVKQEFLRI